jgi:hypothetical protein
MSVRLASERDLDRITEIYERARKYMRENGNPDQWGSSYPSEELLRSDIDKKLLHVVEFDRPDRGTEICGVFALFGDGDPIYNNIEGKWLNDLPHAAIHRVASSGEKRGVLRECVEFCLTRSQNLKIDTHEHNLTMQNALTGLGFSRCGTIYLEDGDPRIAYQLYKTQS